MFCHAGGFRRGFGGVTIAGAKVRFATNYFPALKVAEAVWTGWVSRNPLASATHPPSLVEVKAMNTAFETTLKENLTKRAVGTSALRNQMRTGGIRAVHDFLCELGPRELRALRNRKALLVWLDMRTDQMERQVGASHSLQWGSVRKALNLWLRDMVCNHHFRSAYGLDRPEPWLEVLLDSHTAAFIRQEVGAALPRWTTIVAVTPDFSSSATCPAEYAQLYRETLNRVALIKLQKL